MGSHKTHFQKCVLWEPTSTKKGVYMQKVRTFFVFCFIALTVFFGIGIANQAAVLAESMTIHDHVTYS